MKEKLGSNVLGKPPKYKGDKNYNYDDSVPHPVTRKMPEGSPEDKTGYKNISWERYVPTYPDGTVSFDNAGFMNTSHGTSCAGCGFYVGGRCMKIRVGGVTGEHPKVDPGNCCIYHVSREKPSITERAIDATEVAVNKHLLS